jgi:hypothetical protein
LEPVPRTLKNSRFCKVLGTGFGKNPKFEKGFQNQFLGTLNFEKGSSSTGTGTGSGTLKNTLDVVGFLKPVLDGTLNLKKGSRTGSWET